MSQIDLVLVNQPNSSILYPKLKTIWPEPYASEAFQCLDEDYEDGQIFYIKLNNKVIGMTGYWQDHSFSSDLVHLRWTGIIKKYRGKGYARDALIQLARLIKGAHLAFGDLSFMPCLVELIPDNEYGRTIVAPFFKKLGFEEIDLKIPGSEDEKWPVKSFAMDIAEIAKLRNNNGN